MKPCTSVVVHDHDVDFAPFASDMCGAYQHGGSMNMSRQSMASLQAMCASMWPFDGIMDYVEESLGDLTGGLLGEKKSAEEEAVDEASKIFHSWSGKIEEAVETVSEAAEAAGEAIAGKEDGGADALEVADKYVGRLTVLVENVKKCCKHHPKLPASLKCNNFVSGFQNIALGFRDAVFAYFKDFANPESWKEGVCKLMSIETATKPIRDAATSVAKLVEKLQETCIEVSPGQAAEMMKVVGKGIFGMPQTIVDGMASAKNRLQKAICLKLRSRS